MTDAASFPATLDATVGPLGAVELALYAAASGDLNPMHLDEDVARAAGFERPIVHGMASMAWAARLFTDAFGAGSVRRVDVRFTGTAPRGARLRVRATLDAVEDGVARYALVAGDAETSAEVLRGTARVVARARR